MSTTYWLRVVTYAGPATNWVSALALKVVGSEELLKDGEKVRVFYRHSDVIEWAKRNGVAHLEF